MRILPLAVSLVSAMHSFSDPIREALELADVGSNILQHAELSDMINGLCVSKTFNKAAKAAIRSVFGDYIDPQSFNWLKAFTYVAQLNDVEKKKNVLRFLNIIWPETDIYTYKCSYLRYSFLLLAQFSLGQLTHLSDGLGGPAEILKVPASDGETAPKKPKLNPYFMYIDVRKIECPADCSNIHRALFSFGIIKTQGLSAQYFLSSKKITEEDFQDMTPTAYDNLNDLGSILILGRPRPESTHESKTAHDFEVQWRNFEAAPKPGGLEKFFLKVMHEAPDHYKTLFKEQLMFYMLSKTDEDFVDVSRWKSIGFWGPSLRDLIDLCKEYYEPVDTRSECIII